MPTIHLGILHSDIGKRIVVTPSIPTEPAAKLLDGAQVMVACLDAQPVGAKFGQVLQNIVRRQIADHFPTAGSCDSLDLRNDFADMFCCIALVEHCRFPVGYMFY
ncbi:MAG: hypothetical protein O2931_18115 [Planctomycetota bacterium]|nr:hypothetical protein [Planctomycetota bacterium]